MLPCLSKKYFGMDCIGCGMQRATAHLLRGEFVEAFHMYPAIYPLFALLGYLLINQFISLKHSHYVIPILSIFTVAVAIVNYVVKLML